MAGDDLQFVAVVGSLRHFAYTKAIANTLDELAPDDVMVSVSRSVGRLPYYSEDLNYAVVPKAVVELWNAIEAADGAIIVTPEHSDGFPGVLKNALDWLGRSPSKALSGKPVAIQTAALGVSEGASAQDCLREILASIDACVLNGPDVFISDVASKVDASTGSLRDEKTRVAVAGQLAALAEFTRKRRHTQSLTISPA